MMEKCPKCGKYMVAFDSYRKVKRCHIDGCTTHVYDDGSYSVLYCNDLTNKAQTIQIFPNGAEKIIREWTLYP